MSNARFYPNDSRPDWWADLPGYNGTVQVEQITGGAREAGGFGSTGI